MIPKNANKLLMLNKMLKITFVTSLIAPKIFPMMLSSQKMRWTLRLMVKHTRGALAGFLYIIKTLIAL